MLLSTYLSQGQDLTSEFFMARLGQFPGHWSLWWSSFCFSTQKALQFASLENWQPLRASQSSTLWTVDTTPCDKVSCAGHAWLFPTSCMDISVLHFEWHLPGENCYKASSCSVAGRWGPWLAPARSCQLPRAEVLGGAVWPRHWLSLISALTQSDNFV